MSASSSFELDRPSSSSEPGQAEEVQASTTNANLNKKLKKIDMGEEIKSIKCVASGLIIGFLILVGLSLSLPIIYSVSSIQELNQVENIGFTMLFRTSIPNGIVNGVF